MAYATVYSPEQKPLTLAEVRALAAEGAIDGVDGDPEALRSACISWPAARVTIAVLDPERLGAHLAQVMGLVASAAGHPVLRERVGRVRQVLGISAEPSFEGAPEKLVRAVGLRRKALVLRAGGIYEPAGGCLLEFGTAWVARVVQSMDSAALAVASAPGPARIFQRARCLAAVAHRGRLDGPTTLEKELRIGELQDWLRLRGLEAELEAGERELIHAGLDEPPGASLAEAAWRIEGAAVLAWSLGLFELPPHDRAVDPERVGDALAYLAPAGGDALARARLRAHDELAAMADRLRLVHWRLGDMPARHLDFRRHCLELVPGPVDLTGVALVDDDLAVDGVGLSDAPLESIERALLIARERQRAIDWVLGSNGASAAVGAAT